VNKKAGRLVSMETVVLPWWKDETQKLVFINGVNKINWLPSEEVQKLTFRRD